eukprot:11177518-Alexandrium_andersonii.AAC.1
MIRRPRHGEKGHLAQQWSNPPGRRTGRSGLNRGAVQQLSGSRRRRRAPRKEVLSGSLTQAAEGASPVWAGQ